MILDTWSQFFARAFQELGVGIISFIPGLFFAVIVFIVGWVVGIVLGKVVTQIIRALRVDNALRGAGVEEVLRRGGFNLDAGKFLGSLVEWFVIVVFLVASFDVLGLSQVNTFLQQVVILYLPRVIVAVFVLLVSAVIAETMQRIVVGASRAAEIKHSNFLGSVTRWSIWIFAILTALYQLGVAQALIQTFFTGFVVAFALAVGLAFGLGGQDAAAKYLAHLSSEFSTKPKK
ncbi:MAG: small-conductance mechanosensitive ion channel [Parcubacteria group bacterium Gr01-1014_48]|nr:MAG: small-conductance mechanosensitive ion channel [Parcubacteria group bacterium Greene0416_14]TSC73299.1 MAG: small-conductance mechanosensitive ion channel [Parcubacteria group bacterium Gr01-1014_48]TSC99718.1 MAG: small-conductance mechanosensitive ion channel [Parcubacteria group bacterium Greene1014_15]TSD07775.1 MAG: small-conductance mechanosensitive ion channel [Parcubacteria group bacterium Greene0714_4]